tara:strand:+ start:1284 stop:1460 length:177 start_codon:yes stop_codon:yes gene_type:complete
MSINAEATRSAEAVQFIDEDFILDLYIKAKEMPDKDDRDYQIKVCKNLTKHLGSWLTK